MYKTPTWQRKAGQNPEGGLNEAGRKSLRAAGHDIKRPQPEGGARKKSFCARMRGAKKHNTSAETANDPDSRINKSLRKWKCADGGEVTANLPIMARQPDVEIENALRAAKNQSSAPYEVIDMGDKIIVGAAHGEPVEVSEDLKNRMQQVSKQHGAWYEGTGGDVEPNRNLIPQYKGSWDDQYAKSVKGYPIEYLSPLFSNVDVNKQYEVFEDPKRSIMDSLISNQDRAKYFKDRKYDQKTVQEFLKQGSEGDVDFIKLAQQPATKENLQRFFSTGERLMWPENWQEYPHNLGKLAKRLEENRNRFLLNAPPGVYITGAGHIPEIKSLKKDIRVIGGEKSSFADGGEVTVDNALRMARGRPDEGGQERFLREQLAGSAPQYEPSQDFPARAERAVQVADRYAGVLNDLAARGAGLPKEFQSPQGRSAREIVESALPQDPNAVAKQAMQQWREGDKAGAVETMAGGLPETGAIRAYHGSPYRFDKFDLSKIGTGEGAQAYGHGLYFAENEGVARGYRDDLSSFKRTYKGVPIEDVQLTNDPHVNMILKRMNENPFDDHVSAADAVYTAGIRGRGPYVDWEELRSARDALGKDISRRTSGHMYEVEIAAEPHQLLDWDKPLSEQPEAVRESLHRSNLIDFEKNIGPSSTGEIKNLGWSQNVPSLLGEKFYRRLTEGKYTPEMSAKSIPRSEAQAQATKIIREAGIPGIQYLDAGSRGAGEGSRNFVIFDPSLIDIKRRYADGGDVTVDNALRMARNMGGGTLYNQLNYAFNSPTPANPPQDPGPQQPYYQSLPQTRDIIQQYGTPAPGAPTSTPVRQPMPYAKGGKAIWNKPRPKSLGKSEPLSPAQKASAKAAAKAAGRPYPNFVDNIRAAKKATQD